MQKITFYYHNILLHIISVKLSRFDDHKNINSGINTHSKDKSVVLDTKLNNNFKNLPVYLNKNSKKKLNYSTHQANNFIKIVTENNNKRKEHTKNNLKFPPITCESSYKENLASKSNFKNDKNKLDYFLDKDDIKINKKIGMINYNLSWMLFNNLYNKNADISIPKNNMLILDEIIKHIENFVIEINDYFYQITETLCTINEMKNNNNSLDFFDIIYNIEKRIHSIFYLYHSYDNLYRLNILDICEKYLALEQNISYKCNEYSKFYKKSRYKLIRTYKSNIMEDLLDTENDKCLSEEIISKKLNLINDSTVTDEIIDINHLSIKIKYYDMFKELNKDKILDEFLNLGLKIILEIKKDFFKTRNQSIMVVLLSYLTFTINTMNENIERIYFNHYVTSIENN